MPYKDEYLKKRWEQQHRLQRLARRRELRRSQAVSKPTPPAEPAARAGASGGFLWVPIVGGAALAFYDPRLAIGAGCLALVSAALSKAGAIWWFAGVLILAVGLLVLWIDREASE